MITAEVARRDRGVTVSNLRSYGHSTLAIGGYRTCDISFSSTVLEASRWINSGLGAFFTAYDIEGETIWEGVIDRVQVEVNGDSIEVGPLLNIINRVKVEYSTPDFGGTQNSTQEVTDWLEDTDSIKTYGSLENIISAGEATTSEAYILGLNSVAKTSSPEFAEEVSTDGKKSEFVVSLNCVGLTRVLEKQIYNSPIYYNGDLIDVDTEIPLKEKVRRILEDNAYLRRMFGTVNLIARGMEGVMVSAYEDGNRTAWGIIEDDLSKADLEGQLICGFFSGMQFELRKIDTALVFQRRMGSGTVQVAGRDVPPTQVRPGIVIESTTLTEPILYIAESINYDMSKNRIGINQYNRSLRSVLESTMLGGRI